MGCLLFEENEKVRKATITKLGWVYVKASKDYNSDSHYADDYRAPYWINLDGNRIKTYMIPEVERSWEDCVEHLVRFLQTKGWDYRIDDSNHFTWANKEKNIVYYGTIIDDNICLPACQIFLRDIQINE